MQPELAMLVEDIYVDLRLIYSLRLTKLHNTWAALDYVIQLYEMLKNWAEAGGAEQASSCPGKGTKLVWQLKGRHLNKGEERMRWCLAGDQNSGWSWWTGQRKSCLVWVVEGASSAGKAVV